MKRGGRVERPTARGGPTLVGFEAGSEAVRSSLRQLLRLWLRDPVGPFVSNGLVGVGGAVLWHRRGMGSGVALVVAGALLLAVYTPVVTRAGARDSPSRRVLAFLTDWAMNLIVSLSVAALTSVTCGAAVVSIA